MGKKKKQKKKIAVCWYCERKFDDEGTLIQHQKAKHFKCPQCNKRMNSVSGLGIHLSQVHKVDLDKVPAAISGRDSLDYEVFGMIGYEESLAAVEEQRAAKRARREAPQATGVGVGPGAVGSVPSYGTQGPQGPMGGAGAGYGPPVGGQHGHAPPGGYPGYGPPGQPGHPHPGHAGYRGPPPRGPPMNATNFPGYGIPTPGMPTPGVPRPGYPPAGLPTPGVPGYRGPPAPGVGGYGGAPVPGYGVPAQRGHSGPPHTAPGAHPGPAAGATSGPPQSAARTGQMYLVYDDDLTSMEEKRARLPKYTGGTSQTAPTAGPASATGAAPSNLSALESSIASRLNSMGDMFKLNS